MKDDKGYKYRGERKIFQKSMPRVPKHTLCYYCKLVYANSWDHILPYSYGGTENIENLVPCCRNCNSILSNILLESAFEKMIFIQYMIKGFSRLKALERIQVVRLRPGFTERFLIWLEKIQREKRALQQSRQEPLG